MGGSLSSALLQTVLSAAGAILISAVASLRVWMIWQRQGEHQLSIERRALERALSTAAHVPRTAGAGAVGAAPSDDRAEAESEPPREVSETDRFAPILVEYYAYGLTQAKRHSNASLTMSTLGGLLLLVGAGFMLFRSQTGTNITGAALSSGAGLLTNAIAVLFHRQANQALQHMQAQSRALRDDMRQEREAWQALEQLDRIDDPRLRDHLRAGVVLRLANATMPHRVDEGVAELQENLLNGRGDKASLASPSVTEPS